MKFKEMRMIGSSEGHDACFLTCLSRKANKRLRKMLRSDRKQVSAENLLQLARQMKMIKA